MTITCSIDHDQRYMTVFASGLITWEEIRSHLLVERFEKGLSYRELIDGRDAIPAWSSGQAREIVTMLTAFGRKSALGPTAVLVSHDVAFGMLRMLEILLEDVCLVKPFYDYEAAKQWLLKPEAIQKPTSDIVPLSRNDAAKSQ